MTNNDLRLLFEDWKTWCATADRSDDGWESDYPQWQTLIEAARKAMTQQQPTQEVAAILAECWSASQEDEELLSFACDHLKECWPMLQVLAQSSLPGCRWQIYEAVAGLGHPAEPLLREGLCDQDDYARRRALLSLARVRPADAQVLATGFLKASDPYIRQATIEMVLVAPDTKFQRDALTVLRADSADHVRRAAEAGLRRIGAEV